ncbi:MAG: pilus assembly protein PilN [Gammaproteobacteria bacterium]|nr:pilus assembly protein PilN [Gammaproteobacteria bacterium]MBT5205413.1 pilus assembly protein PilN [Gammaproteobacteria bacterium]MBT5604130.1 pilus assembly protein PilN [Gammaproteobacteria bacterium]MBT6245725.1 pilus assembly protein PilN [Gammaproteobacteria bacterium]
MADIKINLLPWRQRVREEQQRQFINIIAGLMVLAVLCLVLLWQYYGNRISDQEARNRILTSELSVLENKIEEIRLLQLKRKELLDRMKVIQELQGNRPVMVRLFDELARQLAARVFFDEVRMTGETIFVSGVAEDNNRISNQLRNFSTSDWFVHPNVTKIDADDRYGPLASRFSLSVMRSSPKQKEEAE